ncbi:MULTISPECIES: ion channel [Pedobacter]|uniref:Inward rectifier potassium channel n=1 Tax=Pedobacter zeae TaxID=1737356 RepID=A0A7W6P5B9_9SPHI|nr:ion channel [Pedobacter zeae]MBB4108454.1 inward rectifier potassium channel [Pedobacter zeae]GGG92704.1 inward rectifier potassium channel Irk [Pedobacter zeae]
MVFFKRKVQFNDDLGFASNPVTKNQRMINPDGSANIERTGLPWFKFDDTYTRLVTMSWPRFFLVILVAYLLVNTFFAILYNLIGIENLVGANGVTLRDQFFDAFFFSAQTISTVGYGHISPQGFITSVLAAFESMLGLLAFALATGLLYGRFSRPTSKVSFSKKMVIAPYKNGHGLMCRLVNLRRNQLIEVEVQMVMSYNEMVDDKQVRRFYPLQLERDKISILSLNWTLVHPITEESPLFEKSLIELQLAEVEVFVMLKAFDDTFAQTIHTRTSYQDEEIEMDARFEKMYYHNEAGKTVMDYSKLDEITKTV